MSENAKEGRKGAFCSDKLHSSDYKDTRETHAERVRDGEVLLASEGREGGADDATDGRTVTIREIGGGGGGGGDVCSDDNDGG